MITKPSPACDVMSTEVSETGSVPWFATCTATVTLSPGTTVCEVGVWVVASPKGPMRPGPAEPSIGIFVVTFAVFASMTSTKLPPVLLA